VATRRRFLTGQALQQGERTVRGHLRHKGIVDGRVIKIQKLQPRLRAVSEGDPADTPSNDAEVFSAKILSS
jgi:hypothetical protein